MPIRARSFGRAVFGSPIETPSTVMVPASKGSSPLTHLIKVDFPDPDGPHTTTTSPLAISALHLLSTCTLPYHLLTLLIVIMGAQRMMAMRCCRRRTPYDAASEMTKYTIAANRYISTSRPSRWATFDAAPRKSVTEIT